MKTSHPKKKKPEDIQQKPLRKLSLSQEDWEEFHHGVTLFNTGKFWHAHEAWEQVWVRHSEDERLFFQGLIQLAAAYHHLVTKRSLSGMNNNFDKARAKLEVFQPKYLGISVTPLLKSIEAGKKETERLGEKGIDKFNFDLIPKLQFQKPINPDLLVEIKEICRSEQFIEGIRLFNKGYHWEAHETWEGVWRDYDGDAKLFVEAFVKVASGYSFLKLSKASNAQYLFEKALEKFHEFEHIDCRLDLSGIIANVQEVLTHIRTPPNNGNSFALKPNISLIQE